MFLSIFNFLKCLTIIFLFNFFPKWFLKILVGKKIFKNRDFYLDSHIESNFKVLEKKIKLKEINLIARAKSLVHVKEHINFNLPTFFINFYDSIVVFEKKLRVNYILSQPHLFDFHN